MPQPWNRAAFEHIWTMNSLFEMVGWCWLLHKFIGSMEPIWPIFCRRELEPIFATKEVRVIDELLGNSPRTPAPQTPQTHHFYNVKPDFYNVYNIASHLPSIFCDWIPVPDMWCQVPLGSFRPQASHSASFFYAVSWSEVRIGQGEATDLQWSTDLSGHWHKTW